MDGSEIEGESEATVKFLEDKITYNCLLSKIKNRCCLREGDKRKVKWRDSQLYRARIKKIRDDGKVDVQFLEDKVCYTASINDVDQHERVQVGDIRSVKWLDGRYYQARILRLKSTKEEKKNLPNTGLPIQSEAFTPKVRNDDKIQKKGCQKRIQKEDALQQLKVETQDGAGVADNSSFSNRQERQLLKLQPLPRDTIEEDGAGVAENSSFSNRQERQLLKLQPLPRDTIEEDGAGVADNSSFSNRQERQLLKLQPLPRDTIEEDGAGVAENSSFSTHQERQLLKLQPLPRDTIEEHRTGVAQNSSFSNHQEEQPLELQPLPRDTIEDDGAGDAGIYSFSNRQEIQLLKPQPFPCDTFKQDEGFVAENSSFLNRQKRQLLKLQPFPCDTFKQNGSGVAGISSFLNHQERQPLPRDTLEDDGACDAGIYSFSNRHKKQLFKLQPLSCDTLEQNGVGVAENSSFSNHQEEQILELQPLPRDTIEDDGAGVADNSSFSNRQERQLLKLQPLPRDTIEEDGAGVAGNSSFSTHQERQLLKLQPLPFDTIEEHGTGVAENSSFSNHQEEQTLELQPLPRDTIEDDGAGDAGIPSFSNRQELQLLKQQPLLCNTFEQDEAGAESISSFFNRQERQLFELQPLSHGTYGQDRHGDEPVEVNLSPPKNRSSEDSALVGNIYDPDYLMSESDEDDGVTKLGLSKDFRNGNPSNKETKKNMNYCFYCETMVNDFARHIIRNHKSETSVQQILATKKGKMRNELFSRLRKKGNFINAAAGYIKPVKKLQSQATAIKVRACPYCHGYYARKQLWRHRKTCVQNNLKSADQLEAARRLLLQAGQTLNLELVTNVFSRMHDSIPNQVAKNDELICAFGSKFLKTHKQKHQATTCSRKMRELAFVIIELKKIDPEIKNLTQALKPENFDNLLEAAKKAAGYDPITNKYRDSAFAMNICTSLKECCEIAILDAIKRKHTLQGEVFSQIEAELKTTILLLMSNWRSEVSHDAANNLHINRMNKVSMVPLASDLKLLKDYLVEEGTKIADNLKCDVTSVNSFQRLVEICYCRVLLLCRKRPGELQRMTTDVYVKAGKMDRSAYEEFQQCLTPTETLLLKRFQRVVIQGKRKEAPVLFAPDVKEHVDLLIDLRKQFVIDDNEYLFPRVGTDNPIVGYKVLAKFAKLAKCQKPAFVTTRGLRKHLATICQLFQMNDNEIEQLSTFMGHTSATHRNNYRLPDDIYQTAKLAKLLMMMERGEGAAFKGKRLEDINVPLEEDYTQENSDASDNEDLPSVIPLTDIVSNTNKTVTIRKEKTKETPRKREVHKWTPKQKHILTEYFSKHISDKRAPKKNEIDQLKDLYPDLGFPEDWKKIKVFVQNVYSKPVKKHEVK